MDITSILNDMITSGSGLLLVAAAYLLSWASAFVPNLFSPKAWNWKKGLEDFAKAFLMGLVLIAGTGILNLGSQFFYGLGWDITGATEAISTFALIGAMSAGFVFYIGKAAKNAWAFFNLKKAKKEGDKEKFEEGQKELGTTVAKVVTDVVEKLTTPKNLAKKHEEYEAKGGRGGIYVVSAQNYDAFRNEVMGKGYDIDNAYGYQCWDGTALLWQQLGRNLLTGNGCASGCWTLKRDVNAGGQFDLITNKADVKRGDVVVFSTGQYGHIGFADENYNGSGAIKLLGQNQGGTPKGAKGGAGFNVINMSMATFLGAFRFKNWKTAAPAQPIPSTPQKANEVIADEVIAGKWGNNPERKQKLEAAGYDYSTIQAIVNAKVTPKTPPAPVAKPKFAVGDMVKPIKPIDYTGRSLIQYDASYVITQLDGDRAVLSARGSVWAAMNVANLRKA